MAGWAGYQLIGTKEKIVDDLKTLVEGGVDGILLNWPKYIEGMERFKNEVHPGCWSRKACAEWLTSYSITAWTRALE